MTKEEKSKAIKGHCINWGYCSFNKAPACPLYFAKHDYPCYDAEDDIDYYYDLLVKAGLIAPDDEIETENDEIEKVWDRREPMERAYDELHEAHERFMNIGEDDKVNHPTHYTRGGIECIDAIKASMTSDGFCDYCKGNIIKYLWRWRDKGGAEDLHKARVYLDWLIEEMKK